MAGQELKDIKCDKNPGHQDFIPFKDITLKHLPNEDRNKETLDMIKKTGKTVVRTLVDKIKNGRRKRETGSGSVYKYDDEYFIKTNNHVVKTDDEVKRCIVEFHYDDVSRSSIVTSRGVKLRYTCPYKDISFFTFHPIPDFLYHLDWLDNLTGPSLMYINNHMETVKTFPYRRSIRSQLSLFISNINLNSSQKYMMFISHHNDSYSYLKSFYFKFKPIPSNIQQLASITIHIDEGDDNSRVISGDVVKFGDEFVVKMSESIFQDEVKKCRLVWNGEVIGRGTRLYFQPVKSRDLFSGIELKIHLEKGRENFWVFDCHPPPKYIEEILEREQSNNVCGIGHPHGGIKMVTFGRVLTTSIERFDTKYRRITEPGPGCQCKGVSCIQYSCKTCPGSSGSLIFILFEMMKLGISYIHIMGEKVKRFSTGGGIENINMAWTPL